MRSIVALGVVSLAVASGLVACGDDSSDARPSLGGSGGTSGGSGGGGAGGAAGGGAGGTAGGTAGTGGAGGGAAAACVGALEGGCARIFVPVDAATDNADFEIDLGTAGVDMSNAVVTARVKAEGSNGGALQLYIKNGAAQSYQGHYTAYRTIASTTDWQEMVVDLGQCPLPDGADAGAPDSGAGDAGPSVVCGPATGNLFDTRAVRYVGLQLLAPAAAPFAAATVVVDSIKFSTHPPDDFTFAGSVQGLAGNVGAPPPTGSTVTLAPAP